MKNNYSKRNPSKSYLNNIDYYKIMHEKGYKKLMAQNENQKMPMMVNLLYLLLKL